MRIITPLIAAALLVGAPAAAQIVRHKAALGPQPAIILTGVTVPADARMLYLSGQLAAPTDPAKAGQPGLTTEDYGDTRTQTVSIFNKIKALLATQGFTMADVIKLTVFVACDPKTGGKMDFAGFNEGYKQFFGTAENPNLVARSTVQVAALAGPPFLIEIEATAARVK